MDRDQLYRLILQKEKEFEQNKLKRMLCTVLGYAAGFFVLSFLAADSKDLSLPDLLGNAAACLVISGIFSVINAAVFGYLGNKSRDESEELKRLKIQLDEFEKQGVEGKER